MTRAATALLLLSLGLPACGPSTGPTFQEAVKETYKPCNGEGITAKAAMHAIQLVFKPCGSNNFQNFAWNPQGITLYYRTLQGPWVLKDTGENFPLRLGMPKAPPAWFNQSMLAVPDSTGRKMSVYNIESHILNLLELDQYDPEQLSHGQEQDQILFLGAESPGGIKYPWSLSANTGETERAFGWLDAGMASMTYRPEKDVVCYREFADTELVCAQGSDGKVLRRFPDRLRGSLSVDGRYVVSEALGEPVSMFRDPTAEAVLALPPGVETTVRPPLFWITDMETGEELLWEGVHGHSFQWYDSAPYFASFMLWGFDSEQVNANIGLVDLRHFLKGKGWKPPLAIDGHPIGDEPEDTGGTVRSALSGSEGATPTPASTPPAATP